jgi:hypothetical protein
MKNLILVLMLMHLVCSVYAQPSGHHAAAPDNYGFSLRNGLMGFEYRNPAERFKGNQYFAAWAKGDLYMKDGTVIPDIYLRYDQYLDEVLWLREIDFKTGLLMHRDIAGFMLYDQSKNPLAVFTSKRIKLPYKTDSSDIFLQELVTGKLALYAYRKVIESPNDYNLVDDSRYLLFGDGKCYFVTLKKGVLMKTPAFDPVKLKAVIKANRINLNGTEGDLIRLISLYNTTP